MDDDEECPPTQLVPETQEECAPTQLYADDEDGDDEDDEGPRACFLEDEEPLKLPPLVEEEEKEASSVDKLVDNDDDEEAQPIEKIVDDAPHIDELFDDEEVKSPLSDAGEEESTPVDEKNELGDDEKEEPPMRASKKKKKKKKRRSAAAEEDLAATEDEEAAKKRRAVAEALEKEREAAVAAAEARREKLAARLKDTIAREEEAHEAAAKQRLAALLADSSDDEELEIVGAPKKKVYANKRAALKSQLRQRVVRQGMERFTSAASLDKCGADVYVKRLEALEAQRFLELRKQHKQLKEERELIEKVREKQQIDLQQRPDDEKEALFFDDDDDDDDDKQESSPRDENDDSTRLRLVDDTVPLDTIVVDDAYPPRPLRRDQDSPPDDDSPPLQLVNDTAPVEDDDATQSDDDEHDYAAGDDHKDIEQEGDNNSNNEDDEPQEEEEVVEENVDRAAAYRALLLEDASKARRRRNAEGIEEEAEESDDDVDGAQRGLGDFGFGVKKQPEEDEVRDDVVPTADDLEAIVDELREDEKGNEKAAEDFRKRQAELREKDEMAAMLRNVREGFDTRGRGDALGSRGQVSMKDLVGFDAKARSEAKRLGLADDDDEEEDDDEKQVRDAEDDEAGLAELISRELKERHLGPRRREEEAVEISDSDDEEAPLDHAKGDEDQASDSDAEEERMALRAKHWAKRAKMRRVLTEASHREQQREEDDPAARDERRRMLLHGDENSQLILGMLSRQHSLTEASASASVGGTLSAWPRKPLSTSNDALGGVSRGARDALLTRCGSFFGTLERSNSLLATSGSAGAAPTRPPSFLQQQSHSQSASGRHIATGKTAVFASSNSNSLSGYPAPEAPAKASPREKRPAKTAAAERSQKKPVFSSIWASIKANNFS